MAESLFYKAIKSFESLYACVIPSRFLEHSQLQKDITLESWDGSTWSIQLCDIAGHRFIEKGWRAFCVDNKIEIGDSVLFKIVNPGRILVKIFGDDGLEKNKGGEVVGETADPVEHHLGDVEQGSHDEGDLEIFETVNTTPKRKRYLTRSSKAEAAKEVIGDLEEPAKKRVQKDTCTVKKALFTDKSKASGLPAVSNPNLIINMLKSSIGPTYYLHVKKEWAAKHLGSKNADFIMLDENDNKFPVHYIGHRTAISAGWRGFAKSHNIGLSDSISLEVLDSTTLRCRVIKGNA